MIRHRLRLQEEEVLGQLRTKGQTMFASSRTPPRQKSYRLYSGVSRWQEVDADQNLSQTGARVKRFCAPNGATFEGEGATKTFALPDRDPAIYRRVEAR